MGHLHKLSDIHPEKWLVIFLIKIKLHSKTTRILTFASIKRVMFFGMIWLSEAHTSRGKQ